MKSPLIILSSLLLIGSISLGVDAASPKKKPAKKSKKGKTEQVDTSAKKPVPAEGSIEAVLGENPKLLKGLFTVCEKEGKYFFVMPKSVFGRDLLLVNRVSKAPAGFRSGFIGYAGDQINENMIRFQVSPNGKNVFIEKIMTRELPRDSSGSMYDNVMKSNVQPLAASFEIKGANKSKDTIVIDVTDFFGSDNELISFDPMIKQYLGVNQMHRDRSYILGAKSFPINTELKSVKTFSYSKNPMMGSPRPAELATFEVNTSIIALPEVPMQPRYADNRVGYFTESYVDFDKNPQGVKNVSMITRWRLEPKAEDVEKYKAGELVEPAEPIIYYIDPSTPKEWVPYLIQGVNDWEPVFRKAGFKNAIKALEAPVNDSTWSLDDARHSAIVYKASDIPNASGPHVHDPRTGQILESHINWYHNVMLLLRNWYMLQVGPNDPRAQKLEFPTELMGQLVRFVSSHEVGHTLGLRHNFGATSQVPIDSLRSRTYLQKYGHTPSIMDYSRFNYVVQPEDGIEPELQYPRIKEYDEWAIEWGYRRFPDLTTPESEATKLNQWIIEAQKNPRLWFGHESNSNDPRSQSEDLGDNQMKANALGIKNLERVMKALPEWTKAENQDYRDLSSMYNEVFSQYLRYVGHVTKWVGGIYENPRTQEQGSDVYSYAEKAKQKEAMDWLAKYWAKTPTWLLNQGIFDCIGLSHMGIMENVYNNGFSRLLNRRVLTTLVASTAIEGSKAYSVTDFFRDLNSMVLVSNPDAYQRIMQKLYVVNMIILIPNEDEYRALSPYSDAASVVIAQLRRLQSHFASATQVSDPVVAAHNAYLSKLIKETLDKK